MLPRRQTPPMPQGDFSVWQTFPKPHPSGYDRTIYPSASTMPRQLFQQIYPYIHHWVMEYQGRIEIEPDYNLEGFVRAYDEGGMVYEGNASYPSLDAALADLDAGIKA